MITFRHLLNSVFSLYKPLSISLGDFASPFPGISSVTDALKPPKLPEAPDYTGAAEATAEGNLENARYATVANRPDQTTPWGTSTWTQDPNNPDKWAQNVALSPEQQRLYETNTQTSQRMGDIGLMGLDSASNLFSSRYQTPEGAAPGTYGDKRQSVIDAMMTRSNTDVARQRDNKRSELIAQGIPPGSEAFDREMDRFDRMSVDARQQAEIAAANMATQEYGADLAGKRDMITNALLERQTPLNELNAFRTGTQVSTPTFSPFSQQQAVPGPDYMGAAGAQSQYDLAGYNADVARQNAMISGLFGLGGAAIGRK